MSTNRNRNLSSRDIARVDNNKSNLAHIIVGCGVVCATLGLSICGVTSAVRNIDRNLEMSVVLAQQNYDDSAAQDASKDLAITENKWSSTQIDWMSENSITYNEDGLPVDLSGNVVDDPTTKIDETKITSERHEINEYDIVKDDDSTNADKTDVDDSKTATISDNISDIEPDIKNNWVNGKDWIQTAEDGRYYYSVQRGDTFNGIAKMSGFTTQELVDNNDIANANIINVGQRIYFPFDGPSTSDDTNIGLG